jgi:hypothetical protein
MFNATGNEAEVGMITKDEEDKVRTKLEEAYADAMMEKLKHDIMNGPYCEDHGVHAVGEKICCVCGEDLIP